MSTANHYENSRKLVRGGRIAHDSQREPCYLLAQLNESELSCSGSEKVTKPVKRSFQDNLVLWMFYRRLSISALATRIGVHKSQVSLWSRGKIFPQAAQIDRIAEALDIPTTYLFWDNSDPRSTEAIYQQIVAAGGKDFDSAAEMLATVRLLDAYKQKAEEAPKPKRKISTSKPRKKKSD